MRPVTTSTGEPPREHVVPALVVGAVVATLTGVVVLRVPFGQGYSELVAGDIARLGVSKTGDLLVFPLAVLAGAVAYILTLARLCGMSLATSRAVARLICWWALPTATYVASSTLAAVPVTSAAAVLPIVSLFGIVLVLFMTGDGVGRGIDPTNASAVALACVGWGLVPLAAAVVVARLPRNVGRLADEAPWAGAGILLAVAAAGVALLASRRSSRRSGRVLGWLATAPQLVLPGLLLAFFPARLQEPDGTLTSYAVSTALLVVLAVAALGIAATVLGRRLRAGGPSERRLRISPSVVFIVVIVGILGQTQAPFMALDDYHVGERLLGVPVYLAGGLPYVDYVPPHGLLLDDLALSLGYVFYDGTAASVIDTNRLGGLLVGALLFGLVRSATRSTPLAAAAVVALVPSWAASGIVLAMGAALWLNPRLRATPARWLATWTVTAPLLIIAAPSQGFVLTVASLVLVIESTVHLRRAGDRRLWIGPGVAAAVVLLLGMLTPLGAVVRAAVDYVLSNGTVNQVAWGLPWRPQLLDDSAIALPDTPLVLDVLRMSWVLVPALLTILVLQIGRRRAWADPRLARYLFVLALCVGFLGYVMGRVDPAVGSRPAFLTVVLASTVVPLVFDRLRSAGGQLVVVSLVMVTAAGIYGYRPTTLIDGVSRAGDPFVATPELVDGPQVGLPGAGRIAASGDLAGHFDAVRELARILDETLPAGQPYFDLTSRNAVAAYLARPVVTRNSAVLNMPSASDQRDAVAALDAASVDTAVVQMRLPNLDYVGTGTTLRVPLLVRHLIDEFTLYRKNGMTLARRGEVVPPDAQAEVKLPLNRSLSDETWDRGVRRDGRAIALDDFNDAVLLTPGDRILAGGAVLVVTRVESDLGVVEVVGPRLGALEEGAAPRVVLASLDPDLVSGWLVSKALTQQELASIPSSWGEGDPREIESRGAGSRRLGLLSAGQSADFELPNGLTSDDVDLVGIDVRCQNGSVATDATDPQFSIAWEQQPGGEIQRGSALRFSAAGPRLLIPLDASGFWLTGKDLTRLQLRLENPGTCTNVSVSEPRFYARALD